MKFAKAVLLFDASFRSIMRRLNPTNLLDETQDLRKSHVIKNAPLNFFFLRNCWVCVFDVSMLPRYRLMTQ